MRIYKRKNIWYVDYVYKGKRTRKAIGPNKKIAQMCLNDIQLRISREENLGIFQNEAVLFKDYAEQYLSYSKNNKAEGSYKRDITNIKNLTKAFGDFLLGEIKPDQIEKYKIERRKVVSSISINRELSCLFHMFTVAIQTGVIHENPLKGVKKLKEPPGRLRYLSLDEIDRLLDVSDGYLRDIIMTALNTGMRYTEILELEWQAVDLDNGIITLKKTKSGKIRMIPINLALKETLVSIIRGSQNQKSRVYLRDGKPIKDIRYLFAKALKEAEISDFHFHDLRHTFASHLVMSGAPIQVVQQILGHSTIQMTMRYAHLAQDYVVEAMNNYCNRIHRKGTNMAHDHSSKDRGSHQR
ncbi:MAG TPA: site-specific integrase [candidate division Zixibacteria bacterium]|nr:site-specific integrase [candidate division Zixibacteria bacterium]